MGVVVYKKEKNKEDCTSLVIALPDLYGYEKRGWFLSVKDAMDHEGFEFTWSPEKLEKEIGLLVAEVKSKKISHRVSGRTAHKLYEKFQGTESATLKEVANLQAKVALLEEIKKTILATLSTLKVIEKKYVEKHNPKVRASSSKPEEGESETPPSKAEKEIETNLPLKNRVNPSNLDNKLDDLVKNSPPK